MSDFLLASQNREPLQESFSDDANPLSLDGVEFIEYVTAAPQALGEEAMADFLEMLAG